MRTVKLYADRVAVLFPLIKSFCRDRILQGYRYYRQHSYVSTANLETMTKLYNAYHGLGGNGTITTIYDKICALPVKEAD